MTREEMMDNVIRKFGFEVKETISFCRMCVNAETSLMSALRRDTKNSWSGNSALF